MRRLIEEAKNDPHGGKIMLTLEQAEKVEAALNRIASGSYPEILNLVLAEDWRQVVVLMQADAKAALEGQQ